MDRDQGPFLFCSFSAKPWPSPVRRTSPIGNSSLITAKKKKDLENSEHPSASPHWDTRIAGQTIQTKIFQPAQLNSCSSSTTSRAHLPQPLQPSRRCVLRLGSLPTATPCPSSMSPVDGSHHPILPSSRPATCDDDGRQCVCPTSQPPLPSAVCRLPQPARSPPTRDGPSSCMHILYLFHRRRPPQRAGPLANRPGRCVGRIQTRHSSATSVLPMQHSRQ